MQHTRNCALPPPPNRCIKISAKRKACGVLTINENVCSDPTSCVLCFFFFFCWGMLVTCGQWIKPLPGPSPLALGPPRTCVCAHRAFFSVPPPAPGVAVDGEQCNPHSTPQHGAVAIPAVAQAKGFWPCSPVPRFGLAVAQLHFSSLKHLAVGLGRGKLRCWGQRGGGMGKFALSPLVWR